MFKAIWKGPKIARPDRLVLRWGGRTGLQNAKGGGRPQSVSHELATKAAELFVGGYTTPAGAQLGFRNVAHAERESAPFAALAEEAKCCSKTLLKSMQRVNPSVWRAEPPSLPTMPRVCRPAAEARRPHSRDRCSTQ